MVKRPLHKSIILLVCEGEILGSIPRVGTKKGKPHTTKAMMSMPPKRRHGT